MPSNITKCNKCGELFTRKNGTNMYCDNCRIIKCYYCGKTFDRDKLPYVQVSAKRYAHQECSLTEEEKRNKEEQDKCDLENYIMQLFKTDYVDARIHKQIKQYREEYNYTYSGIRKALVYFFEIKGNSIEKANGGIGIVPYVYKEIGRAHV